MNINLTLLGQMITFGILVWVTMRYVWPPLTEAMEERRLRMVQGEAAAEEAKKALADAQQEKAKMISEGQAQKDQVLADAEKEGKAMVLEAKGKAKDMADRLMAQAKQDVAQQMQSARDALQNDVATLVVDLTERMLQEKVDAASSTKMIERWLSEHE